MRPVDPRLFRHARAAKAQADVIEEVTAGDRAGG
jgi:hypothetical protein